MTAVDERPQNQLLRFVGERQAVLILAVRIFVLCFTLVAASICSLFYGSEAASQISVIYYPLAALFLLSGGGAIWLRSRNPGVIFSYSNLSLDAFIITGVIYVTGGAISPFLFLYLPLVMGAAIVHSRRLAFLLGILSTLLYSGLVLGLRFQFIPSLDGSTVAASPTGGLALQMLGLASALFLIAVATEFLKSQLTSSYQLVQESQRNLGELTSRQRALIAGVQDGVIVTQLDRSITSINDAAAQLLRIADSEVRGMRIESLLGELRCSIDGEPGFPKDLEGKHELEIFLPGADQAVRIVCHAQSIKTDQGESVGRIYIFQDVTRLRSIEAQLAMQERMARLLAGEEEPQSSQYRCLTDLIGESPLMQKIFALVDKIAQSEATVLVSGESGTGKELVARAVHLGGPRSSKPFVPVNCGAIPESLIESELFGHKKGAFTGANSDHLGLFRLAEGGTLFLDEIGELPLQMQAKLLRALQERTIHPVGGASEVPIDVRIVAATNRNLRREVEQGNFREDLFYRLNVISIQLPPLRDRREDLPLLVHATLMRLRRSDRPPVVPPATMAILMNYHYPGNVRELENILERALVLGGDVILPEHLPEYVQEATASTLPLGGKTTQIIIDDSIVFPVNLDQILSDIERRYLESALEETHGAKKKAAELLGINFRSLRYRLQKFGIGDS